MLFRTLTSLAVFVFSVLWTGTSDAQIYLGGKMAFQASTLKFADKGYQENYRIGFKPGINLGGAIGFMVTKSFDLYGEFVYSLKGAPIKSIEDSDIRNRISLSYIDFPILLRTNVYHNPQLSFFLQMGPTIGYWLKGGGTVHTAELQEYNLEKASYNLKWTETSGLLNEVYVPEANRFQLGLNLGLGGQLKLRHHMVVVDLRYEMGHTHLSRSEEKPEYLVGGYEMDFKGNSSTVIISTAYLFNIDALRRQMRK